MNDLYIPLTSLAIIFAFVAFFYASVGLGGGSSYTALLAIFGASASMVPMVSLTLNTLVTTIGSITFLYKGHARIKLIAPFLITSIPAAYLGGLLQLPKVLFYCLLIISLAVAAFRIYFPKNTKPLALSRRKKIVLVIASGALLGFIAGVTGIGGGVYLVPLIILFGLGTAKEAAACGAFFIWANSVSGLLARFQHSNSIEIDTYFPLIIGAVIGGLAGSYLGAGRFRVETMQRILGSILVVAVLLLGKKVFVLII